MIADMVGHLERSIASNVPGFDIGHVSTWQAMASLPPVYHPRLLASSISIFTTILLKEPCIFNPLVKRTSSS